MLSRSPDRFRLLWLLIPVAAVTACGQTQNAPDADDVALTDSTGDVAVPDDGGTLDSTGDDAPFEDPGPLALNPPSGTTPTTPTSTFESSFPEDEAARTVPPDTVTVRFTKPLDQGSGIMVWLNKATVLTGAVEFSEDRLSMSVPISPELPATGVYDVAYRAVSGGQSQTGRFVFYVELLQYEGTGLSSIAEFRDNSIKGPVYVDLDEYRLEITGLVDTPLSLTYAEVLELARKSRIMDMNCVEGWTVSPLWTGIPIMDLVAAAGPRDGAVSLIFTAVDGYDDFLPISWVQEHDTLLAFSLNQVPLPAQRGFPFQVAAEGKWGYKWVKWLKKIEVSDAETYVGFWERYGYSVDGDLDEPFR